MELCCVVADIQQQQLLLTLQQQQLTLQQQRLQQQSTAALAAQESAAASLHLPHQQPRPEPANNLSLSQRLLQGTLALSSVLRHPLLFTTI